MRREEDEETMHQENTVRIGLGSTCIEICCEDEEFMGKARSAYRPFLVSGQPDFRINFNLRNKLTASEIKPLLTGGRSYVEGGRYVTEPELLECRVDWSEATLWVDTEKELFAPELDYKLMNPLLRGIYPGIFKKLRNTAIDAYLVHGCGIATGERCLFFTGPSGSGKTTIARLAEGRKVLNDETVLVSRNGKSFYIAGTPFDGGVSDRCSTPYCLSAIFFLKHDTRVTLRRLGTAEAYRLFLSQVLDTSPFLETPDVHYFPEWADISAAVVTEVPSYELGFRPDTSFWQVVENI